MTATQVVLGGPLPVTQDVWGITYMVQGTTGRVTRMISCMTDPYHIITEYMYGYVCKQEYIIKREGECPTCVTAVV